MITLYQFATSPFTEKVRRALNYKGIVFDTHEVDRAKAAAGDYRHVSKVGKFPAIDHDGMILQDSTDILEYLDTAFKNRPLLPQDARSRALATIIEDWADESLYFYEMTVRLSWTHNLDEVLDKFARSFPHLSRNDVRAYILDAVGKLITAQGVGRKDRSTVVRDLERHFGAIESLLEGHQWLLGDNVSSADISVTAQVSALLDAQEARAIVEKCPNIRAWRDRLDAVAPFSFDFDSESK
ncbi:glutathione S-transferase family protein [Burkholderia stagnalis]